MTDEELKELVQQTFLGLQQLRVSQAQTDEQMKRNSEEMKRNSDRLDEQMKRNDERLTAKLERIGVTLGNIGNNQGAVAEEFFYNSLKGNQTLAGVHYDFIDKNVTRSQGAIEDEFDIIMVNGKDVALIEVKYKAHEADLTKLLTKKYENFKKLFPMYKDYTHHLALATFSLYEDLKELALSKGVIVLQRKGDTIESFVPA